MLQFDRSTVALPGYRRVERRNLQAGVGQDRIGQIVRAGQRIEQLKLLVQGFKLTFQIRLAVRFNGKPEITGFSELRESLRRQEVFIEVLELPRTFDPDVTGTQGVLQLRQGA